VSDVETVPLEGIFLTIVAAGTILAAVVLSWLVLTARRNLAGRRRPR
jgi:hypothetical protein